MCIQNCHIFGANKCCYTFWKTGCGGQSECKNDTLSLKKALLWLLVLLLLFWPTIFIFSGWIIIIIIIIIILLDYIVFSGRLRRRIYIRVDNWHYYSCLNYFAFTNCEIYLDWDGWSAAVRFYPPIMSFLTKELKSPLVCCVILNKKLKVDTGKSQDSEFNENQFRLWYSDLRELNMAY